MSEYTKIGRIRPSFRGEWSSAASYTVLDIVRSPDGAAAYAALKDVPAGTLLSNAAYWEKVVEAPASGQAKWSLLESLNYGEESVNSLERTGLNLKGLYIWAKLPVTEAAQNRNVYIYLSNGEILYSYVQNSTGTSKARLNRVFCELSAGGKREFCSEVVDVHSTQGRSDTTNADRQYTSVGDNEGVYITRFRFESTSYDFPAGTEIEVWGHE